MNICKNRGGDYINIIFLDVDGVLNSMAYFKQNKSHGIHNEISDFHLKKLSKIYHVCDCKIVLSSTWRDLDDEQNHECYEMYQYLVKSLAKYDMNIISKTPVIRNERPLEIKTWIDNRVDKENIKYISLDDDFDKEDYEKYGIEECLVKTRFFCHTLEDGGLQQKHVDEAIRKLCK